jgi:BON domain
VAPAHHGHRTARRVRPSSGQAGAQGQALACGAPGEQQPSDAGRRGGGGLDGREPSRGGGQLDREQDQAEAVGAHRAVPGDSRGCRGQGLADADIRWEVLNKVILGEFFAQPTAFSVTVRDGVVTLTGRPETAEIGHGIVLAVRHIEGVVAVRDQLSYPVAKGPRQRRHAVAR